MTYFVSFIGKNEANCAAYHITTARKLNSKENLSINGIAYLTIMQTNDQGDIVESLESPNRVNINGSTARIENSTGMYKLWKHQSR